MKVVAVHNFYQRAGGEDAVFRAEAELFEAHGHSVVRHTAHNDAVREMGAASLALATVWSGVQYRQLRDLLRRVRPDVVHVHNTFPLISPAVYYAARAEGAAVVQSLHNARLICPAATFFRDGRVCTDCFGKTFAWPGVVHACYRGSRAQTLGAAGSVGLHRLAGTWARMVDRYIAFSPFYRDLFVRGGLPAKKVVVKPHFVDPDPGEAGRRDDGYALYVGRLDPEKGVRTLFRAWRRLRDRGRAPPLKVAGTGTLRAELEAAAEGDGLPIEMLGHMPRDRVVELMKKASFLIWPSESYETFGLVAAEAFACGVPVLASDIGVARTMVEHGRTGLRFTSADEEALADTVDRAFHRPEELRQQGRAARAEYLARYTADANYRQLLAVYLEALEARPQPRRA